MKWITSLFFILLTALRIIWICHIAEKADFKLIRLRPWYIQKKGLSQLDIQTIFEEYLNAEGIYPTTRFWHDIDFIHTNGSCHIDKAA